MIDILYWIKGGGELQLKIERVINDCVDFEIWHWVCPTCKHKNEDITDRMSVFACSKCGELMFIFRSGKYQLIEY